MQGTPSDDERPDPDDRKFVRQADREMQTFFENIDSVLYSVDMQEYKVLQMSPACEKVFGYTVWEMTANPMKWLEVVLDEDRHLIDACAVVMKRGEIAGNEHRIHHKDGSIRWVSDRLIPTLDKSGQLIRIDGIASDITARKEAEEAYAANLRAANQLLKKTNEELDRFVYSVSHDLRAPLVSLLGLLEYTEGLTNLPEVMESMAMMRDSVQKLDAFVLDILDYSRNSRTELQLETIGFEELIEETVSHVKFMGQDAKDVSISWTVRGECAFRSDRTRLKMIIGNLLSNAIRYTDPDKSDPYVKIEVTISAVEAVIVVRDNGLGIDPKYHTRIFDMFFRLSSKSVGSGLGLYIVREAVEKIAGRIELSSAPGLGSKFSVIIPTFAVS